MGSTNLNVSFFQVIFGNIKRDEYSHIFALRILGYLDTAMEQWICFKRLKYFAFYG